MGSSLYRLPAFCHADSLIPAVRFFRKEKSSFLRAGCFLHRTRLPAQNPLETFCVAVSAPPMELNFFFTKKWVGGRSSLRGVPARQDITSLYRLTPTLHALKKDGNPRGRIPGASFHDAPQSARRRLAALPFRHTQSLWLFLMLLFLPSSE